MKKINLFLCALLVALLAQAQTVADFEGHPLAHNTYWDGSDLSGGFSSGNGYFVNSYNAQYHSWSGFTFSNMRDTVTAGAANQYSAVTGGGYYGSANYAVGNDYGNAKVRLINDANGKPVTGCYVTNATYAYLSMKNGGDFGAKKFGGVSGNDPDWFRLTVKGYRSGSLTTDSVDFYLADFRSGDNSKDYFVKDWQWLDLRGLGNVDTIQFFLASSDTNQYGMLTPAYFCIDEFATGEIDAALPIAKNDAFMVNYSHDTIIAVLGNDFDTANVALTINIVTGPVVPGATAVVSGNGILYTPAVGIATEDTIHYTVCDPDNHCNPAIAVITIPANTAVTEIPVSTVQVAPNPFSSFFTIYHTAGVEQLKIYDVQGKEVRTIITNMSANNTGIDAYDLPTGLYFIKLLSGTASTVTRIVKQ